MIFKDFETMAYVFLGVRLTAHVAEGQMTYYAPFTQLESCCT